MMTPRDTRKPYVKPAVAYEARLEAQAGSPIGSPVDWLEDVTLPQ